MQEYTIEDLKKGELKFGHVDEISRFVNWVVRSVKSTVIVLHEANLCENKSIQEKFPLAGTSSLDGSTPIGSEYRTDLIMAYSGEKTTIKCDTFSVIFKEKRDWKEIYLSRNNLSADESKIIIKAIVTNQFQLRRLNFALNSLNKDSQELLENYLSSSQCTLKYLVLEDCFIRVRQLTFLKSLATNNSLRELNLGNYQLSQEELAVLNQALLTNEKLVSVHFQETPNPTEGYEEAVKRLKQQLGQNRVKQQKRHQTLLDQHYIMGEMLNAIVNDNKDKVDIFLGIPKAANQKAEFKSAYELKYIELKQAILKLEIATQQLKILERTLPDQLPNEINAHLDRITKTFEEHYKAEKSEVFDNLAAYKSKVITPAIDEMRSLNQERNGLIKKLQTDIERLTLQLSNLKASNEKYLKERQRLLDLLSKTPMGTQVENEIEELADQLIEIHFSPNDVINDTTLLFKALNEASGESFALMLAPERGGDIMAKNTDGNYVFKEVCTDFKNTSTHNIALKHIKEILDRGWDKLTPDEQKHLQSVKNLLWRHLTEIGKGNVKRKIAAEVKEIPTGTLESLKEQGMNFLRSNSLSQKLFPPPELAAIDKANEDNELYQALEGMFILMQKAQSQKLDYPKTENAEDGKLSIQVCEYRRAVNIPSLQISEKSSAAGSILELGGGVRTATFTRPRDASHAETDYPIPDAGSSFAGDRKQSFLWRSAQTNKVSPPTLPTVEDNKKTPN